MIIKINTENKSEIEEALIVLNMLISKIPEARKDNPFLKQSIETLQLPTMVLNALLTEGIRSIDLLTRYTETELFHLPNMGKKGIAEIKSVLDNNNLQLGR